MKNSVIQFIHRSLTSCLSAVSLLIFGACADLALNGMLPFSLFVSPANAEYKTDFFEDVINSRNDSALPPNKTEDRGWLSKPKVIKNKAPIQAEEQFDDIWAEIRAGFRLGEFTSRLVERHEKRFIRNPDYLVRTLERAKTYLPYILEQTKHYNLPSEIALLPLIESGYNPRIYSSRGAAGLWQFMPATGLHYGLKQDWWYEGRRDITYSTQAALQYLTELNQIFDGDWPLAIAAYNAGHNYIKKAIRRNQQFNKPTDLKSLNLYTETRNFYPKLIAVRNIVLNPEAYGIELPDFSLESPFKIIEFDFQVDLVRLAEAINVDALQLALLNPGLRRHATPPDGPYRVLVPTESFIQTLNWKRNLHPVDAVVSTAHTVKPGETLNAIAQQHAVSVATLKLLNSKKSDLIRIGEIIHIPPSPATVGDLNVFASTHITHTVVSGDSLSGIAETYRVRLSELRAINGIDQNADLIKVGQELQIPNSHYAVSSVHSSASINDLRSHTLHQVTQGESLWSIAQKYNVSVSEIVHWNKMNGTIQIKPEQKLIVYIK